MRYATGAAFRAALDDRLPLVARTIGLPLDRIRKAVAFERFLARLTFVAPDRWCLKGGLALNARSGSYVRPSRDIDIGHFADLDQARRDLVAAQNAVPPEEDHFRFQVLNSARLPDPNAGGSIRFQLEASLAGRVFDQASVDVAFEPDLAGRADVLALPTLLEFADVPPVSLQVVTIERHLADKIDAYLRGRINTRALSSREKDLVDMVMIAGFQGLVAGRLRSELEMVANTTTGPIPTELPEPPISWGQRYRVLAQQLGFHEVEVAQGFRRMQEFLDPVLGRHLPGAAEWSPSELEWKVPGTREPGAESMKPEPPTEGPPNLL